MSVPLPDSVRRRQRPDCILLDACIPSYVYRGLKRRGFNVRRVGNDVTQRLKDFMIVELGKRWGCVIVTKDRDFEKEDNAVIIPQEWFRRYNSWEIVTKIIKRVFSVPAKES